MQAVQTAGQARKRFWFAVLEHWAVDSLTLCCTFWALFAPDLIQVLAPAGSALRKNGYIRLHLKPSSDRSASYSPPLVASTVELLLHHSLWLPARAPPLLVALLASLARSSRVQQLWLAAF